MSNILNKIRFIYIELAGALASLTTPGMNVYTHYADVFTLLRSTKKIKIFSDSFENV